MKLATLSLSKLFQVPVAQWPASLQAMAKDIFITIMDTILRFNQKRAEKEAESDETSSSGEEEEEGDSDDHDVIEDHEDIGDSEDDDNFDDEEELYVVCFE